MLAVIPVVRPAIDVTFGVGGLECEPCAKEPQIDVLAGDLDNEDWPPLLLLLLPRLATGVEGAEELACCICC